jgi:hypothetical protein
MANSQPKYYNQNFEPSGRSGVRGAKKVERRINDDWQYLNKSEANSGYASNDEVFQQEQQMRLLSNKDNNIIEKDYVEDEYAANEDNYTPQPPSPEVDNEPLLRKKRKKAHTNKEAELALKAVAKAKVTAANISIFSWGGVVYVIQLIVAFISLALLGVAIAVGTITSSGGILGVASSVAGAAADAFNWLTGVDLNLQRGANNFFIATHLLVVLIGYASLVGALITYKVAMLRPLFGRATTLKITVFLFSLIFYAMPILNLFPWVLVFAGVVWKYPR